MSRQAIFEASVHYFLRADRTSAGRRIGVRNHGQSLRQRLRRAERQAGAHRCPVCQRRCPHVGDPQCSPMGGQGDQRGASGARRPAARRLPRSRRHPPQCADGHLPHHPQVHPRSPDDGRPDPFRQPVGGGQGVFGYLRPTAEEHADFGRHRHGQDGFAGGHFSGNSRRRADRRDRGHLRTAVDPGAYSVSGGPT